MRSSRWLASAAQIARDYATGPDGRTFALGRALGAALFVGATPLPVVIGAWEAVVHRPTLADWGTYLTPAAAYYAAIAAAVTGLIQLTSWSEPKGPGPCPPEER